VVQRQGMIVRAGNGRVLAARELGWTHLACVVVDESEVEATAFAIADNRSAELASGTTRRWPSSCNRCPPMLSMPPASTRTTSTTCCDKLAPATVEEDDARAVPKEAVSRSGDLWLLGEHRLLCGDSTKSADVLRVMNG
jgi:hypothetical protein